MSDYLLVLVLSFDTFLACIAFAVQKIKIPFASKLTVAVVGTVFLSISIFSNGLLGIILPEVYLRYIGFAILFLLGIINISETLLKKWLKSTLSADKPVQVSFLRLTLNICLDSTCADADLSKTLSPIEALMLALPLSIDSLFTGLSMNVTSVFHVAIIISCSFIFGIASAFLGTNFATRIANSPKISSKDFSWISGILLLLLAFEQLF